MKHEDTKAGFNLECVMKEQRRKIVTSVLNAPVCIILCDLRKGEERIQVFSSLSIFNV
jgi:hypothetical protein